MKIRRLRSCALATVVGASALACVTANEGTQMKNDIAALQAQVQQQRTSLDEQSAQLVERLQRADVQVKELSEALAELNRAARGSDADFGVQLDQMRNELQELRGQVELAEYHIGQVQAQISAVPVAQAATPAAGTPSVAEDTARAPVAVPKDKKGMLAYAANQYAQKNYSDARGVYREIAKQWPNEMGVGDLAHMRIGDTFYDEKNPRAALPEYAKVAQQFSKGEWADDAYYKIGLISIDLGNLEDAQTFLGEVVKTYKKSPLVPQAQAKLTEVQKRLEKEKSKKKK